MFRRPGKNPLEEYKEEISPYKYHNRAEEMTARPFEQPAQAQPMGMHEEALPHHLKGIVKEEIPETTLGEGVTFRGELSFERLLRIDGTFEGNLLSQGKVIIGPKGKVKANLNLREAIVHGQVEGNITVQETLKLCGTASVHGDIRAKSLSVDDGVEILGVVQVTSGNL